MAAAHARERLVAALFPAALLDRGRGRRRRPGADLRVRARTDTRALLGLHPDRHHGRVLVAVRSGRRQDPVRAPARAPSRPRLRRRRDAARERRRAALWADRGGRHAGLLCRHGEPRLGDDPGRGGIRRLFQLLRAQSGLVPLTQYQQRHRRVHLFRDAGGGAARRAHRRDSGAADRAAAAGLSRARQSVVGRRARHLRAAAGAQGTRWRRACAALQPPWPNSGASTGRSCCAAAPMPAPSSRSTISPISWCPWLSGLARRPSFSTPCSRCSAAPR